MEAPFRPFYTCIETATFVIAIDFRYVQLATIYSVFDWDIDDTLWRVCSNTVQSTLYRR